MTDTDTSIDIERLEELIEEYANTERRQKKREIENEVLAETVWQVPEDHETQNDLVLKDYEIARIRQKLPDDAHEARRLLRRHNVKDW